MSNMKKEPNGESLSDRPIQLFDAYCLTLKYGAGSMILNINYVHCTHIKVIISHINACSLTVHF